jgi:hypothetical protein
MRNWRVGSRREGAPQELHRSVVSQVAGVRRKENSNGFAPNGDCYNEKSAVLRSRINDCTDGWPCACGGAGRRDRATPAPGRSHSCLARPRLCVDPGILDVGRQSMGMGTRPLRTRTSPRRHLDRRPLAPPAGWALALGSRSLEIPLGRTHLLTGRHAFSGKVAVRRRNRRAGFAIASATNSMNL